MCVVVDAVDDEDETEEDGQTYDSGGGVEEGRRPSGGRRCGNHFLLFLPLLRTRLTSAMAPNDDNSENFRWQF